MNIHDYIKILVICRSLDSKKIFLDIQHGDKIILSKDYQKIDGIIKCTWKRETLYFKGK